MHKCLGKLCCRHEIKIELIQDNITRMPSLPTTYSGAISPVSNSSQTFEEPLTGKMMTDRVSDSDDTITENSARPIEPMIFAKRPPLPPFRRPANRLHALATTRSPSPCSLSSSLSCRSRSMSVMSSRPRTSLDSPTFSTPPRRMFPIESRSCLDLEDVSVKEQAPVVFDASLNFVLGCDKQKVRQSFRPTASHMEPSTASSYLSSKISQFLKRTDHIMDEWRSLGHRDDADNDLNLPSMSRGYERRGMGRSQSATNIMIRGYQYYSRSNSIGKSSRRSLSRASEDRTISDGAGQEVYCLFCMHLESSFRFVALLCSSSFIIHWRCKLIPSSSFRSNFTIYLWLALGPVIFSNVGPLFHLALDPIVKRNHDDINPLVYDLSYGILYIVWT